MIGRRAVVGLSLLSALLFCAFAAQSASAAKSIKTTAYTCVDTFPLETGDFKDPHCDKEGTTGKERYAHKLMPENTTTAVTATNEKVTNETKDHEPAVLTGSIGLTKTEISCTKVKNDTEIIEVEGKKVPASNIHNVVSEPEKKHTMTGRARVTYSECTVNKPAKCIIAEPVVAEATYEGVEKLGAAENEMGVEFKGIGEGENFATIEYKDKPGEECALKNKVFEVKGSVIATSGPTTESSQTNNWAGGTLVFTPGPKKDMQKLKLGANTAEFHNIVTPTIEGSALSATTVTT